MEGVAQVALPLNISWVGVGGTSLQGVYRYVRPKVHALFSFSVRIWFLHSSSALGMFFLEEATLFINRQV